MPKVTAETDMELDENDGDDRYLTTPEEAQRRLEEFGYGSREKVEEWVKLGEEELSAHIVRALARIVREDTPMNEDLLMDELHGEDMAKLKDLHQAAGVLGFFEPPSLRVARPKVIAALRDTKELPTEFFAYRKRLSYQLRRQIANESNPTKKAYPYKKRSGALLAEATLFRDAGRLEEYLDRLRAFEGINSDDMPATRVAWEIEDVEKEIKDSKS